MPTIYDETQTDCEAFQRFQQYEEAIKWCKDNHRKEKAALAHGRDGRWNLVTVSGLKHRLTGEITNGEEYADRRILTLIEEVQLAKWLRGMNRSGEPQDRDQTRLKIVEILEHRQRTRGSGRCAHTLPIHAGH